MLSHVTALSLVVDYCYRASGTLEDSDNLREFVNFLLAFRVCELYHYAGIDHKWCSCICNNFES